MTADQKLNKTALLLGLMANPTRLKMMLLLSEHVELSVKAIQGHLGSRQSLISHNLSIMMAAGLVTYRSQGKYTLYSLIEPELMDFLQTLIQSRTVNNG